MAASTRALATAGEISQHLQTAPHKIRFAGNEIAPGDLAKEPVTADDAKDILALMDAILLRVREESAQVEHVRVRRKARVRSSRRASRPLRAPRTV